MIWEAQQSYFEHPIQKMYPAVKFIKSDQPALNFFDWLTELIICERRSSS